MLLRLWQRVPVIVRAVIVWLLVSYAGILPWSGIAGYALLAGWNLRVFTKVPWAVLPMSVYLWLYWKYLNGWDWRARPRLRGARVCVRTDFREKYGECRWSPA